MEKRISLSTCKKILNKYGSNYSDEQVLAIRDFLYEVGQIDYEVFIYNEEKEKALKEKNAPGLEQ